VKEPRLELPRVALGCFPTPVERLRPLGRRLGCELWIKRDDLSGERYGGNKVRKLELLLGAAVRRGCRAIVTAGGIGSNHVVATAYYGRQLGLPTHAVLVAQPPTAVTRDNLELIRRLAAGLDAARRPLLPLTMLRVAAGLPRPALIGPGGSSPLGCLGHVLAAFELARQIERGELPPPERIVVASGSGGTLVGLWIGLAMARVQAEVVGVRVVEPLLCNELLLRLMAARTLALLRALQRSAPAAAQRRAPVPSLASLLPRLRLVGDQLGAGYGSPTPAAERAVAELAEIGLRLETTYTGKAMAHLLAHPPRGRRVLFWHTYNSRDASGLAAGRAVALPPSVAGWLTAGP